MRIHLPAFFTACVFSFLAAAASAQQNDLVLGISEGTSGGLDHAQVIVKYQGLAEAMTRAVKRKVVVVFAREFAQLEEGMKSGRYDFVLARPSDYPARGVRNYGYQYVVSAKPDGQCLIVSALGSDITTLAQARGKRWIFPEKISYMSRFCNAEMRDKGVKMETEKLIYVREQALIAQYVQMKLVDVGGIASYSGLARQLEKNGLQVIHKSVAQPYFPMVANRQISKTAIAAVQKELLALSDTAEGNNVLKSVGIEGFEANSATRLSQLLVWLEK